MKCINCKFWHFIGHEGMANREFGNCDVHGNMKHQYNWCNNGFEMKGLI